MRESLFSSLLVASNPAIDAVTGDTEEGLNLLNGFTREAKLDHLDSLPLSLRHLALAHPSSSSYPPRSTNMIDCIHARIESIQTYTFKQFLIRKAWKTAIKSTICEHHASGRPITSHEHNRIQKTPFRPPRFWLLKTNID